MAAYGNVCSGKCLYARHARDLAEMFREVKEAFEGEAERES